MVARSAGRQNDFDSFECGEVHAFVTKAESSSAMKPTGFEPDPRELTWASTPA
jgi:hypothetical protein